MTIQVPLNTDTNTLNFLTTNNTELFIGLSSLSSMHISTAQLNIKGLERVIAEYDELIAKYSTPYELSLVMTPTQIKKGNISPVVSELFEKQNAKKRELERNYRIIADIKSPSDKLELNRALINQIANDINDKETIDTILTNFNTTIAPILKEDNLNQKVLMLQKLANQFQNTENMIEELINGTIKLATDNISSGLSKNDATGLNEVYDAKNKTLGRNNY